MRMLIGTDNSQSVSVMSQLTTVVSEERICAAATDYDICVAFIFYYLSFCVEVMPPRQLVDHW